MTPYQEPRCLAWYSRWAFLLRLCNGVNCFTEIHLLFVMQTHRKPSRRAISPPLRGSRKCCAKASCAAGFVSHCAAPGRMKLFTGGICPKGHGRCPNRLPAASQHLLRQLFQSRQEPRPAALSHAALPSCMTILLQIKRIACDSMAYRLCLDIPLRRRSS